MPDTEAQARKIPVVVVAGPTASGKSTLALAAAEALDGEIINADSMQVYRDLRIVTARPTAEDEARLPHSLFGFLDGDDPCSVGRWRDLAIFEIRRVAAAGRLPILVGGTGMYLNALINGLATIPDVPATIIARLHAELDVDGPEALHAALASRDPLMAERLKSNDRQRLVRAMSVLEATGRSLSAWQNDPVRHENDMRFHVVLMMPARADLYDNCNRRFHAMLDQGAIEEVMALRARQLIADRPVMKAIGVSALMAALDGQMTRDEAVAAAQQSTRNYAKRQVTWFRHQIIADQMLVEKFSERIERDIFSKIRQFRLTRIG